MSLEEPSLELCDIVEEINKNIKTKETPDWMSRNPYDGRDLPKMGGEYSDGDWDWYILKRGFYE